jgi:hypothetical protein
LSVAPPVPLAVPDSVSHDAELVAVHAQVDPAWSVKLPLVAAVPTLRLVGDSE